MISTQSNLSTSSALNTLTVQEQIDSFRKFNEHNFVHLTRHLYRQVTVNMNKRFETCGYNDISTRHLSIFDNLECEGTNIVTLAQRAKITKQAMGKLVREASSSGYIKTHSDPSDSRSTIVQFTDKGLRFLKNMQRETDKAHAIISKTIYLSPDELMTTFSTLSRILDYFDKAEVQKELFFEMA